MNIPLTSELSPGWGKQSKKENQKISFEKKDRMENCTLEQLADRLRGVNDLQGLNQLQISPP